MYFQKSKVTIIIADDKTSVIHVIGKKLLSKWEIQTNDSAAIFKLRDYIIKDGRCVVYIMLNYSHQVYQHHSLDIPFTSNKSAFIKSLISQEELRQSVFADLVSIGKNENRQHYLMVAPVINAEWADFANSIHIQFKGFSLVPLECKEVINVLSLGLEQPSSKGKFDVLLMCYSDERVQAVIYRDDVFLKTEFITLPQNNNLTVYTGYIKQSFDTVVADLNITSDHILNGYIIVSDKIRRGLLFHTFHQRTIIIISPYEASIMLDLDWIITQDEAFCDVMVAYNIINDDKSNYLFNANYSKRKHKISSLNYLMNCMLASLGVLFILFAFYMSDAIHSEYVVHKDLIEEANIIQADVHRESQLYSDTKFASLYVESVAEISGKADDDEALQYVLCINKRYRDEIMRISYDNRNETQHSRPPNIRIDARDNETIKCKEKYNASRLYANIYYEKNIY